MSKKAKKCVALLLAVFMLVALLAGCAKSPAATGGKDQVVKLKHWVWLDDPKDPTFLEMVKEFNATHPNIQVEVEVIPWGDFRTRLLTSVAGGGAPDTACFKLTWVPEFTGNKALQPLDSYLNSWNGKADVQDNLWDVFRVTDDKQMYVMPWIVQALYMYYRPSLFKEAGVEIPQTWDEFLTAAQKLTVDKDKDGKIDQYGFSMRGARYGHEPWGSFVFASVEGNKIMDNGKVVFNTPEAKKANQMFIDLYRKYKVVPPTAPADGFSEVVNNFKSGKTAMLVHHIRSSLDMEKQFGADVSAFPVPAGPKGRWTSLGDTENVIFSSSKNKEAAFVFLSWLSEKNQIDKWCKASGNVPVLKSVQKMDYYQNNRFMKASFDSLPFAHVYPVTTGMGEWIESVWPAMVQQALEGKISADEMMDKLAEEMNKK
ncbi:sugar ABC transporter substrate-binding protein [Sporomusa sp.]|uniref:ABC transporter substrate-binding protein n=1 Tax=Sporomusa sp. TaxID=2078658 RepID=UPI002CFAF7DB|nr:sugar ABC transporter substrate-binding protein [Sporomusa sp.]HWR45912.1 sugar ABC transporter substrate-binding protein [Sporomusa sp.]